MSSTLTPPPAPDTRDGVSHLAVYFRKVAIPVVIAAVLAWLWGYEAPNFERETYHSISFTVMAVVITYAVVMIRQSRKDERHRALEQRIAREEFERKILELMGHDRKVEGEDANGAHP